MSAIPLLALVFLLQTPGPALQQTPSPEPPTEQAEQEQAAPDNPTPTLQGQQPSETQPAPAENPGNQPSDSYTNILARSAIVQAVAAVFIAAFTIALYFLNRGLLRATKQAAEAAADTAKAAIVSNEYLINKERARLRFSHDSLPSFLHSSKTFSALPRFTNYGASEAIITSSGYSIVFSEDETWITPDRSMCSHLLPLGPIAIDETTGRHQVDKRLEHMGYVYFYGFVEYRDVFGIMRETCFYYRAKLRVAQQNSHGHPIPSSAMKWEKGREEYNRES